MKTTKTNNLLLRIPFLLLIIMATSCNHKPNDEQILQAISDKIKSQPAYENVNATVADHVVTLSGTCTGENCVANLEEEVKQVDGVSKVENNVSQGETETDYTLRTSVQNVISRYEGVTADVAGGVVVLRGTIQKDRLEALMSELSTLGAKKIDNQLAVQ